MIKRRERVDLKKQLRPISKMLKFVKSAWFVRTYIIMLCLFAGFGAFKYKSNMLLLINSANLGMKGLLLLSTFFVFAFYVFLHYWTYKKQNVKITYMQMFKVVSLARFGFYMPGRIMFLLNYYLFSKHYGVPTDVIGKNFVINNAVLFFTGALCSLFAMTQLPFLAKELVVAIPFLMLILMHPKVLNKTFDLLATKLSQLSVTDKIQMQKITYRGWDYIANIKLIGLYLVLWIGNSITLYCSVNIFYSIGIESAHIIISTAAASLVIGHLAVFAPAGIGVREGVGAFLLSQIVPMNIAVMAFLMLRLGQVITDILVGGIVTLSFMGKMPILKQGEKKG